MVGPVSKPENLPAQLRRQGLSIPTEFEISDPVLVESMSGEFLFWKVPVTYAGKAIGFLDLTGNGSISRFNIP